MEAVNQTYIALNVRMSAGVPEPALNCTSIVVEFLIGFEMSGRSSWITGGAGRLAGSGR